MTTASIPYSTPSARPRSRGATILWARALALLLPVRRVDPVRATQALELRCLDLSAW